MKKKIFALIVGLLILISVPVGVLLVRRDQELRLQAQAATVLSLLPSTITKELNEEFSLSVKIETGQNLVQGVQLVINYNSQVLEAIDVTLGNFFGADPSPSVLRKNLDTPGKIFYDVGCLTCPESGDGIVAIVTFKASAEGTAIVSFDSTSKVRGPEEDINLIENTIPGTYTVIAGGQATATPTAGATATPVVTATATPIVTVTPTQPDNDGRGGDTDPTSTPTPTTTTTIATPTPITELPETGISLPTLMLIIGATALFIGGLLFI